MPKRQRTRKARGGSAAIVRGEAGVRRCGYKPASSPWHASSPYYPLMFGGGAKSENNDDDEGGDGDGQTNEEEVSTTGSEGRVEASSSSPIAASSTLPSSPTVGSIYTAASKDRIGDGVMLRADLAATEQETPSPISEPAKKVKAKLRAKGRGTLARTTKVPCLRPRCANCQKWYPKARFEMTDEEGIVQDQEKCSCVVRLKLSSQTGRAVLRALA